MKKVVSPSEVAHLWANQLQSEARNSGSTFYFEHNTIFSYGRHFPIAAFITRPSDCKTLVMFTERTYSKTTAKHIAVTRSACSHYELLFMRTPLNVRWPNVRDSYFGTSTDNYHHQDNINHWTEGIKAQIKLLSRARKREKYLSEIRFIVAKIEKYCDFFELTRAADLTELLEHCTPEKIGEYTAIEAARLAEARRVQAEQEAARRAEELEKFRTFKTDRIYTRGDTDYLRYNAQLDAVQTSQGVNIPAAAARRLYADILQRGTCAGDCGIFIEQYKVAAITETAVIIGCHTIERAEIENCYRAITA